MNTRATPRQALLAALALSLVASCREAPYVSVRLEDPGRHWQEGGFTELVPTVGPPTAPRDGRPLRVQVLARLPDGKRLSVKDVEGSPILVWPPGSEADRVELEQDPESGRWAVADVRGTRVLRRGGETFHVLRPEGPGHDGGPLFGYRWNRTRAGGGVAAHEALADDLAEASGFVARLEPDERARRIASLKLQGHCALCHAHRKKEVTDPAADDLPLARTDDAGWYTPLAVLVDEQPLDPHRPLDVSRESPFVTLRCSNGSSPRRVERAGGVRFDCGKTGIARARFDLAAALAAGDDHAQAVCASRRWIHENADEKLRTAFASAFAVCTTPPPAPDVPPPAP